MQTVIEFPEFIQKANKQFGKEEREKVVEFLSRNPKAGKSIENFGGIRKLEMASKGKAWRNFEHILSSRLK